MEVVQKLALQYPVLCDPGNRLADRFRLTHKLQEELQQAYRQLGIDLERSNGDDSWTLPMPARYIVDQRGIIRAVDISVDHTVRPEPGETVAALESLV